MYTAPDCAARAALQATSPQCEFSLGGCKGGISLFEKEIPLPYPHPLRGAGNANKGGISLFKKEISLPYTLPEKISIASEQLKELQCLPIALPARGVAALALQDDLPLLLLSAAALPIL